MPTTPLFLQISQVRCNFAVIIICQFPYYLVLGPLFWECPPPRTSCLPLTLGHYPEALKRKVGGGGLAGRDGSMQGTVIYLDCYLKSIGWGVTIQEKYSSIRLYNKQIAIPNKI
jgi:hypothetical protein